MKPKAFTLIELLVVTATILVLVTLSAAAVSGARSSQRKNQTRVTISKINDILMSQWRTYPSQSVRAPAGWTNEQYKRWNRITGDMPPNWHDVETVATHTSNFFGNGVDFSFKTRAQKTYRQFWSKNSTTLTDQYADSECLFLAVMYGGFAGCLDCAGLRAGKDFTDTDNDDAQEFIDAWGNPLGFVLWPAGLLRPDNQLFFDTANSDDELTVGMRPLVFSAGPDGKYGINVGGSSNLGLGQNCGLPDQYNPKLGSVISGEESFAADNITNFDAEFRR